MGYVVRFKESLVKPQKNSLFSQIISRFCLVFLVILSMISSVSYSSPPLVNTNQIRPFLISPGKFFRVCFKPYLLGLLLIQYSLQPCYVLAGISENGNEAPQNLLNVHANDGLLHAAPAGASIVTAASGRPSSSLAILKDLPLEPEDKSAAHTTPLLSQRPVPPYYIEANGISSFPVSEIRSGVDLAGRFEAPVSGLKTTEIFSGLIRRLASIAGLKSLIANMVDASHKLYSKATEPIVTSIPTRENTAIDLRFYGRHSDVENVENAPISGSNRSSASDIEANVLLDSAVQRQKQDNEVPPAFVFAPEVASNTEDSHTENLQSEDKTLFFLPIGKAAKEYEKEEDSEATNGEQTAPKFHEIELAIRGGNLAVPVTTGPIGPNMENLQQHLFLSLNTGIEGIHFFMKNSAGCMPTSVAENPNQKRVMDKLFHLENRSRKEIIEEEKMKKALNSKDIMQRKAERGTLMHQANFKLPDKDYHRRKMKPTSRKSSAVLQTLESASQSEESRCYNPVSGTASWCASSSNVLCKAGYNATDFVCKEAQGIDTNKAARYEDILMCDGDFVSLSSFEGSESLSLNWKITNNSSKKELSLHGTYPVKLVTRLKGMNLGFTDEVDGFWGIAGKEMACRAASVWPTFLDSFNFKFMAIDANFASPKAASSKVPTAPSAEAVTGDASPEGSKNFPNQQFGFASLRDLGDADIKAKDSSYSDIPEVQSAVKNDAEQSSAHLHFGGYSEKYGEIIWSEHSQTGPSMMKALHTFNLYDLEICGGPLLKELSDFWVAEVDLGSDCLVLPAEIWNNFISRLLPEKERKRYFATYFYDKEAKKDIADQTSSSLGPIPMSKLHRPLPILSFNLSDSSKQKRIEIPLDSLIMTDENQEEYLCIRGYKHIYDSSYISRDQYIKFGKSVLNNLYFVFDYANSLIGFAEKSTKDYSFGNSTCMPPESCIGDQIYHLASNTCLNPHCHAAWLFTLDEENGVCYVAESTFPIIIAMMVYIVLMDMLSYKLRTGAMSVARFIHPA